jgi:lysophospholipase L1-like esterase
MRWRTSGFLVLATAIGGCGGGSGSPSGPSGPPAPAGTSVTLVLFYDENANGVADGGEVMRVPDVSVSLGSHTARSETFTGRAVVTAVPDGTYTAALRADTLPPYYQAGAPVSIQVPVSQGSQFFVPLVVDIGNNNAGQYLAFGDSITRGDGDLSGGYPARLQGLLAAHFAYANVRNRGADATNSYEALERLDRNLFNDAFALILYGTNDWQIAGCQEDPSLCPTAENLRIVIRRVKAVGTLPFIATLTPANPAINDARNDWIEAINATIRTMASQEGAVLVDLYQAFQNQGGDLSRFFSDDIHPNGAGYEVIAGAFFEAIAHGRAAP